MPRPKKQVQDKLPQDEPKSSRTTYPKQLPTIGTRLVTEMEDSGLDPSHSAASAGDPRPAAVPFTGGPRRQRGRT